MELRHLRYFVAVAEELHFGRAAARLHMAQPPLSQQILQLERELGFDLFERNRRRVSLTHAGSVYLHEARAILEHVSRAGALGARAACGESGSLAVGFVPSAAYGLLPRVYRFFRERYPAVTLTLTELSTADQVAALHSDQIQLGLARDPLGDDSLTAEVLVNEPLVAALPASYPLASKRTVSLDQLSRTPFIFFPRLPRPGWMDLVCQSAGFHPSVALEAMELSTTIGLVAAGVGASLVPASAQALQVDQVAYRPLTPPAPRTRLLAVRCTDRVSPVVTKFLSAARALLKSHP